MIRISSNRFMYREEVFTAELSDLNADFCFDTKSFKMFDIVSAKTGMALTFTFVKSVFSDDEDRELLYHVYSGKTKDNHPLKCLIFND